MFSTVTDPFPKLQHCQVPAMVKQSLLLRSLCMVAVCCASTALYAQDGGPSTVSEAQIRKMMDAINWPQMIALSLQRGDLQRAAKASVGAGPEQGRCIEEKYTSKRVLARIASGYLRVYSDPAIVAAITAHHETSGARRLLAKVASRTPSLGAKGAYEAGKSTAYDALTKEEQREFGQFGLSPAGKEYLAKRPTQLIIHQEELDALKKEIIAECGK
jgi:hypothetical protein